MGEAMASRVAPDVSRRVARVVLVIAGVVLVAALVISNLPRPITALGTLDQCLWGWPVIVFEGEDWKAAVPDGLGASAPRQIPVATRPSGMRYDETAGALLDAEGETVFRRGDRVRVNGTIVRTGGDPAPCFYTLGVKIETIAAQ
jgi:hypothetical protein